MKRAALLAALGVLAPAIARAQDLPPAHILNLNCIEALAAAGKPELAGIFAYVPDNDTAAAFADLLVHDRKALRKFTAKAEKDLKQVSGVSQWDHQAIAYVLAIYASPAAAATVDKPASSDLSRLRALLVAPQLSLEEMTARRSAKP